MGIFSRKPPVDIDEFDWLLACMAWLNDRLADKRGESFRPGLYRPDEPSLKRAGTASELFDAVKTLAGLSDWHCVLEKGEGRRAPITTGAAGSWSEKSVLGTFSIEGNSPVIRYDPGLLRQPDALVATFAHELAHLLVHSLGIPPGGEELEEHATDCTAVFLGFGVFLANSARHFEQFQELGMHGWRSSTSGYLSENALVTATAIQLRAFGHPAEKVPAVLKPHLARDFNKALKYVDSRFGDVGSELGQIHYVQWMASDA